MNKVKQLLFLICVGILFSLPINMLAEEKKDIQSLRKVPHYKKTPEDYIMNYMHIAIFQMEKHKIPASITMAQALLESGYGKSYLSRYANNHFGIKCSNNWSGRTIKRDDDKPNECFRAYKQPLDSYRDYALFLQGKRYKFLFDYHPHDYKKWAKGLQQAGYATNKHYSKRLIDIIERYKLHRLDQKMELIFTQESRNQEIDNYQLAKLDKSSSVVYKFLHNQMQKVKEQGLFAYLKEKKSLRKGKAGAFKEIASKKPIDENTDKIGQGQSKQKMLEKWQEKVYEKQASLKITSVKNPESFSKTTINKNNADDDKFIDYDAIYASKSSKIVNKKKDETESYHVVQPGETLFSIAKNYTLDVSLLKKINKISSDVIKNGQIIWLE